MAWILLLLVFLHDFLKKLQCKPSMFFCLLNKLYEKARSVSWCWPSDRENGRFCHLSALDRRFEDEAGDFSEMFTSGCEGRRHRQATSIFMCCSALVIYRFSWTSDLKKIFFSPSPLNFDLSNFFLVAISTSLHWWTSFHWRLVAVVTELQTLSQAAPGQPNSKSVITAQKILECEPSS